MASERARAASQFLSARAEVYATQAASLKVAVESGDATLRRQYMATDGLAIQARTAARIFVAEAGSLPEDWYAKYVLRHVTAVEISDVLATDGFEREQHEAAAREGIALVRRFSGRHAARLEAKLGSPVGATIAS